MPDVTLNHLALLVDDLDAALDFWRSALGLTQIDQRRALPEEAVEIAFLQLGDARLELVQPLDDKSGVARYMAKRGPGFHHLCLEVPDLDAMLSRFRERNLELINDAPREGEGRRYAFVHPRSCGGILLELYQRL